MSDAQPKVPTSRAVRADKRQTVKTIGIYVALIAMFAATYMLAQPEARGGVLTMVGACVVFVVLAIVVIGIRFRREARRLLAKNIEGAAAIARGDLRIAYEIFWQLAERTKLPRISALARHNLGWTLMRQGELQRAIDVLTDNEDRNPNALKALGMAPTSAVDLALDYGLLGDLESAETWMTVAEQRANELNTPSFPAMKAFTRAVLDCRAGRCSEAARMLDERWAEYEATLTGETLRPLRIVRAFAIAADGPRNAGLAESAIATVRPAYPGEYDFLGVAWPEMEQFLASHQLSRT